MLLIWPQVLSQPQSTWSRQCRAARCRDSAGSRKPCRPGQGCAWMEAGWELPDNCYLLLAWLGKAGTVWMKKGPLLCSWECTSLFLWSFLSPAKFSIWWHTEAGGYFFLRTTRWCYFILILKSNSIQHKSVKCNVELLYWSGDQLFLITCCFVSFSVLHRHSVFCSAFWKCRLQHQFWAANKKVRYFIKSMVI